MSKEAVSESFWNFVTTTVRVLKDVPVLKNIINYIERSYQHDPFRIFLEVLVFAWIINYLLSRDKRRQEIKLTPKEVDMLIQEWEPEPLVPTLPKKKIDDGEQLALEIKGPANLSITTTGGESLLNFASHNFLGVQNSKDITENAINVVRSYGVGACGPAGFYGSSDIHLALEKQLAETLQVPEAIVYAQGFMAVASVIPAFAKKGDFVVADDGCSFAIQVGMEISRSNVYFFQHNNMEDLERVLQNVDEHCKAKKIPLSRRFIIVEGLYAKSGDKCPLPALLELKKKYKYRLLVDESFSFGCLGPNGKGIGDHYRIPASEIDFLCGSFSNALGSSGGFCAGSRAVVDHQRLSSQAYCFSAALPAMLASSAALALKKVTSTPEIPERLAQNLAVFNGAIDGKIPKRFTLVGDRDSPLRFLRLVMRHEDPEYERSLLLRISKEMRSRGFLLCVDQHLNSKEKFVPPPSLKICLSAGHSTEELHLFVENLIASIQRASI